MGGAEGKYPPMWKKITPNPHFTPMRIMLLKHENDHASSLITPFSHFS